MMCLLLLPNPRRSPDALEAPEEMGVLPQQCQKHLLDVAIGAATGMHVLEATA